MSLKTALRKSAPLLYDRMAYEWHFVRALRQLRRGKVPAAAVAEFAENFPGKLPKECPVCGFTGHFRAFGSPPRYNAMCPSCGALERHRLIALAIRNKALSRPGITILHFAPEASVRSLLDKPGINYRTADLSSASVDLNLNIESIALSDESVDVIVCNHVLEHVDDRRALPQLRRILKQDGTLIATVPIVDGCETTYEDPAITTASGREAHFGQWDHVRVYGSDFAKRLTEAGLTFETYTAYGAEAVRHALLPGEKVFLCRKGAPRA